MIGKSLKLIFVAFAISLAACSQTISPAGVEQRVGNGCQSVGPDSIKQGPCEDRSEYDQRLKQENNTI